MFVRWKRQSRKDNRHGQAEYLLAAHLVESVRIDGKPRQRTVGYLASIREARLAPGDEFGVYHRGYFWEKATARLSLLDLPPDEAENVIRQLEVRVPKV